MINLLIIILSILLFLNLRIGIKIWEHIVAIKKEITIIKNIFNGKG